MHERRKEFEIRCIPNSDCRVIHGSGSITSVGEERANLSAVVFL